MSLENKVAIVTGSTAGIGGEIAVQLAEQGARVVITSRDITRAEDKVAEIRKSGGDGLAISYRLESPSELVSLIEKTMDTYGRLDILVNNAVSHPTVPTVPIQELTHEQLNLGINTNLTNVLALTCKAYPYLKESGGNILNIGSVSVNQHYIGIPLYTIIKGGMSQMTKVLASEWAPDVRVNQINPGFTRTAAYKEIGIPEEAFDGVEATFRRFYPLNRTGSPQDTASVAAFMVSGQASWITGAEINVDGGYSIRGTSLNDNSLF